MTRLFSVEIGNALEKHNDDDFEMEMLLTQPLDESYPPILYCYDWVKVYDLIDRGDDVTQYIDYSRLKTMRDTLIQFKPDEPLNKEVATYKTILDRWG